MEGEREEKRERRNIIVNYHEAAKFLATGGFFIITGSSCQKHAENHANCRIKITYFI